jgi:hypothetical protein
MPQSNIHKNLELLRQTLFTTQELMSELDSVLSSPTALESKIHTERVIQELNHFEESLAKSFSEEANNDQKKEAIGKELEDILPHLFQKYDFAPDVCIVSIEFK